jgi:4-hydroxybenzoate polyprenyltransferase
MLSQILVRYCLILPAFKAEYFITSTFPNYLSDLDFFLLVFSTVVIAAGGYVINDCFDVEIDAVNKPGRNIIGKELSVKKAKSFFYILSSLGVVAGMYVAIKINKPVVGLLPLFAAASLWMYASFYKKRFMIGNVIIAILCSLTVLLPGLYEPEFYRNFTFLIWFAVPAFLMTLLRELIKDMEDLEGDQLNDSRTVPIVLGIPKTKFILVTLIVFTGGYLSLVLHNNFLTNKVISIWNLLGIFLIPLLALAYLVASATGKKDFYYASMFAKILMAGGVCSIYLFWHYFLK